MSTTTSPPAVDPERVGTDHGLVAVPSSAAAVVTPTVDPDGDTRATARAGDAALAVTAHQLGEVGHRATAVAIARLRAATHRDHQGSAEAGALPVGVTA